MKPEKRNKTLQKKTVVKKSSPPEKQLFSKRTADLLGLMVILILGIIVYSNSFYCSFHFDDFQNIVENTKIQNLSDVNAWWNFVPSRPVGNLTFALNYHFAKLSLPYWHLVNLLIHLINACLVWALTRLLFSTSSLKDKPVSKHKNTIALFTALLFVSHPLATQSVTYIVQRLASLAALFYLLSLVLYISARLSDKGKVPKWLMYSGAAFSALLAMMTKENAFTLPFAILLAEFVLIRKKKLNINFKDYRIYLLLAGLGGLILFVFSKFSLSIFDPILPEQGHTYTVTPYNYLLTQFSVIIKYIQLLILPVNQMLDYDFPLSNHFFSVKTLLSFLFLLSMFILAIFLYKRHRIVSFGIFWFFLTLSVEASFIPIPNVIFEHRTYLPSVGFFLILSSVAYLLFRGKYQYLATGILLVIILSNSFLTYERNKVWKDEFTLCNDNIKKAPNSARAVSSRGDIYAERGQYDNAIADYAHAIAISPNFKEVYSNRGTVYSVLQQWDNAIADFSKAISIDPEYAKAYAGRGIAFSHLMKWEQALSDFSKEISLSPEIAVGYYNRGNAYCNMSQWEKAIRDYSKCIELGSKDKRVYVYRGIAYSNLMQSDKAMADYKKALEIDPGYELANMQMEALQKSIQEEKKQ